MKSLMKKQAEKFLREKKKHRRWLAMFLCLALLVTSGTFAALRMDGHAMDDEENVVNGAEVPDSGLYAGELVPDGAQQEQEETGSGQTGAEDPNAGQTGMEDSDAGNADIGASLDGEDAGQTGAEDSDAGNMDMEPQEPENPDIGTTDPEENIEGNQSGEEFSPEEYAEQPGDWSRENVIETARNQIGNTYEQYAAWDGEEGVHREDWTALFASYCLSQAGVEGIPLEADSRQWIEELKKDECGLYRDVSYDPMPGDMVFYELAAEDEKKEAGEDTIRAGLVEEWKADTGELQIIAGDVEIDGVAQVCETAYSLSGENGEIRIEGYGQLPEKDAQEPEAEGENPEIKSKGYSLIPEENAGAENEDSQTSEKFVSWGTIEGVQESTDAVGIKTWDVSSTGHRYLKIPVVMNLSDNVGTKITFPYVLKSAGRKVKENEYYGPVCDYEGIEGKNWTRELDEENNTVTITIKGQHATLNVYYTVDCWNMISDKEFKINCKVIPENGAESICELIGKIHTGHDVGIEEYLNGYNNSNYSFDGLGGADKKTAYIPKWSKVYKEYFGLEKEEFNSGTYVYDVAAFRIAPKNQQPYNISGYLAPDQGGEVLGAVYMMDSRGDPDALCVKLGEKNFEKTENGYGFTIENEELELKDGRYAVVSDLSDGTDSKGYTLYFLVRYLKNRLNTDENGNIELKADLTLKHTGVDNGISREVSNTTTLYEGPKVVTDRIYWASYVSNDVRGVGLTSLKRNNKAIVDFSADFFCLNENRNDFNEENPKKYRLEAVIDLSYLLGANDSKTMLKEGEYQFSSYKLSLIDAEGAWSHNSHGVPNVGWKQDKYGTAPQWADGEYIEISGSRSLTDQTEGTWEKVGSVRASDVWARDQDRAFKVGYTEIQQKGYVRLKVVYNSRRTTALRVGYQMELEPSVLDQYGADTQDLEKLNLRSWFNYLAYDENDKADARRFSRYPVTDNGSWDDAMLKHGTVELARVHDKSHPYPGYEEGGWDEYSLRNYANVTLSEDDDRAGMLVSQTLYDSSGTVVGAADKGSSNDSINPNKSYCKKKEVTNASEIVYSITGIVTNNAKSAEALTDYRNHFAEGSPYRAVKQRYYVLLPEGLTLNINPDGDHNWEEGTAEYLSPYAAFYNEDSAKRVDNGECDVPVSDGRIKGWEPYSWGNLSEMYWGWSGTGTPGTVEQNADSNGQLFIFDRTLTETDYKAFNMWNPEIQTYCWGQGFSFSVVPKEGTGALLQDTYEAKFWCQFLDGNNNPLSMEGFAVQDNNRQELESVYGSNIPENTLLYIPSSFRNLSAAGDSDAEIGLEGVQQQEDGRYRVEEKKDYSYELEYTVGKGTSKNVVLWCNIEGYNRAGKSSEWKGHVKGVDLNGTGAEVYVLTEGFDFGQYLKEANLQWLNDEGMGWKKIDPNTYSADDWKNVKSIAFSFKNRTFVAGGDSSKASVFINMTAPMEDEVSKKLGQSTYTAYNEFIFSDVHGDGNLSGQGKSGHTEIDMHVTPPEIYELPSTGGGGIYWYTISGLLLMIGASLILYKNRSRKTVGR